MEQVGGRTRRMSACCHITHNRRSLADAACPSASKLPAIARLPGCRHSERCRPAARGRRWACPKTGRWRRRCPPAGPKRSRCSATPPASATAGLGGGSRRIVSSSGGGGSDGGLNTARPTPHQRQQRTRSSSRLFCSTITLAKPPPGGSTSTTRCSRSSSQTGRPDARPLPPPLMLLLPLPPLMLPPPPSPAAIASSAAACSSARSDAPRGAAGVPGAGSCRAGQPGRMSGQALAPRDGDSGDVAAAPAADSRRSAASSCRPVMRTLIACGSSPCRREALGWAERRVWASPGPEASGRHARNASAWVRV